MEHFSTEFSANWLARLGQKKSRLDDFVDRIDFRGERKSFNRIGDVNSAQITERHGDTRWSDVSMDLRWAHADAFDVAQPLDEWDAKNLKIPNAPDAERFLRRDYRAGWSLG